MLLGDVISPTVILACHNLPVDLFFHSCVQVCKNLFFAWSVGYRDLEPEYGTLPASGGGRLALLSFICAKTICTDAPNSLVVLCAKPPDLCNPNTHVSSLQIWWRYFVKNRAQIMGTGSRFMGQEPSNGFGFVETPLGRVTVACSTI